MSRYYSPSTFGFYDSDIHSGNIPSDGIEISEDLHYELISAQSVGKVIQQDADGMPIVGDRVVTAEETAAAARTQRDELLRQADISILIAEDAGNDTSALRAYRQALRDVPMQKGFPDKIKWPKV